MRRPQSKGLKAKQLDQHKLYETLEQLEGNENIPSAINFSEIPKQMCDNVMPRSRTVTGRQSTYLSNESIAKLLKNRLKNDGLILEMLK